MNCNTTHYRANSSSVPGDPTVDWDDIPKWGLINKALDLPFAEPVETYSSSPHLYTDLSIPAGTTGRLPRAQRTREGLDAEVLEDVGETGRKKPAARGGRSEGGRDSGRDGGRSRDAAPAEDDAPVLPKRTSSTRQRTRGAGAALAAVAGDAPSTGPDAEGGTDEGGEPRKRRRRGGRGRGRGAAAGEDAGAPAPE